MKLTKSYKQFRSVASDTLESELQIIVNYDPSEKVVDEIISVKVVKHPEMIFTDITAIMEEHFEEQLDEIIEKMDFHEEYASRRDDQADYSNSEPSDLFKQMTRIAYAGIVPEEDLNRMLNYKPSA